MQKGYDEKRGPPRAGIGAQGAAQNPTIPNIDPGPAALVDIPAGEKYSLFLSGVPTSLEDKWLQDILEVGTRSTIVTCIAYGADYLQYLS